MNNFIQAPEPNKPVRESNPQREWMRLARDARLSPAARGILMYILSRPAIWHNIRAEPLAIVNAIGIRQCKALLAELIRAGVLSGQQRIRREDGTFFYTPLRLTVSVTRNPSHGSRDTLKQHDSLTENHAMNQTDENETAADNTAERAAAVEFSSSLSDDLDSGEFIPAGEERPQSQDSPSDEPHTPPPSSVAPPPQIGEADTPLPEFGEGTGVGLTHQLAALGVHEPQLTEICSTYPPDKILAALSYTRQQQRDNPPGYFFNALRFGWYIAPPPSSHIPPARDGSDFLSGKYADIIQS